jgi:hypothetical protein
VNKCIKSIDIIYDLFQRLKLLEGTIKKQQEIENAYLSVQVNDQIIKLWMEDNWETNYSLLHIMDNFHMDDFFISLEDLGGFRSSMQQRIDKVGLAYGSDWGARVETLKEQLRKTKQNMIFDEKNPIHSFSVVFCCAILTARDLGSRAELLTKWDLGYKALGVILKTLMIENKEVIFITKCPSIPSMSLYLIKLDGFEAYKNNFVARMMLADAILKTHPFTG